MHYANVDILYIHSQCPKTFRASNYLFYLSENEGFQGEGEWQKLVLQFKLQRTL